MTAPAMDGTPPTSFKLQHSSPLETLVRRTSSKRVKPAPTNYQASSFQSQYQPGPSYYHHAEPLYSDSAAYDYNAPVATPERPRRPNFQHQLSPPSPLLHSKFARNSTATTSSNGDNSYLDLSRSSVVSGEDYPDMQYPYTDDESVYSDGPALRDSWRSGVTAQPDAVQHERVGSSKQGSPRAASPVSPGSHNSVPVVVVSSPGQEDPQSGLSPPGKAPIIAHLTGNFSRPVRSSAAHGPTPVIPSEEQKRIVLDRNAGRSRSASSARYSPSVAESSSSTVQSNTQVSSIYPGSSHFSAMSSSSSHISTPQTTERSRSPSSVRSLSPHHLSPDSYNIPSSSGIRNVASAPSLSPLTITSDRSLQSIPLPRRPPSLRADSPVSLYSGYSFYQLDSASPSPTGESSNFPYTPTDQIPHQRNPSGLPSSPTNPSSTRTPQDYLQLGIQHHEANRLKESAMCFEKSAKEQGGCGVGMLMWGLTLRHGWGCEKNEKVGFKWLRKAAENAVGDLESARGNGAVDVSAVQSELVLAIYEVGQCFFHGWGVAKDQKMAVSYYRVAARLGDPDAQQDLGFCLANGKGCKKDRKEAAKWYRAAVAQGASDIGLAWIYKEKFQ